MGSLGLDLELLEDFVLLVEEMDIFILDLVDELRLDTEVGVGEVHGRLGVEHPLENLGLLLVSNIGLGLVEDVVLVLKLLRFEFGPEHFALGVLGLVGGGPRHRGQLLPLLLFLLLDQVILAVDSVVDVLQGVHVEQLQVLLGRILLLLHCVLHHHDVVVNLVPLLFVIV